MRHVAGVVAALLLIWIAIASPLATLHHASLTAHMLQHLLLMSVAPPLVWLYLPAVPTPQRWRKIQRAMTHPALCWWAATIVLVAWHVPALFTLAVESRAWHVVQQTSFLIAGLLFWWPVIRPWRIAEGYAELVDGVVSVPGHAAVRHSGRISGVLRACRVPGLSFDAHDIRRCQFWTTSNWPAR